MNLNQRSKRLIVVSLLLLLALGFRLFVGLCSQFRDSDTKQIYLLGLKFYTTHAWPYFGPDVVWGEIQIPGALQALLVGGPFFVLPVPEAPYILLNILSFASLCFLAWYCCKRLPETPRWFVWSWLLTAPWVLNLSTTIYNPSYLLPGSVLFFVAALEIYPFTTKHIISSRCVFVMMGVALFWVMQLHLSWTVLVPYLLLAFYYQARAGAVALLRALGWFAVGSSISGSLLVPTYLKYGLSQGMGGTGSAVGCNAENLLSLWGILLRTLSFASFEVPRFLGAHTPDRVALLKQEPWLIPLAVFLFAVGILQVIALIVMWFFRDSKQRDWRAIKYLLLGNVLILYASFLFSIKPPQSNHLYVTLPLPMIYSLYCWNRFFIGTWQVLARRLAAVVIICGIIFHLGLALHNRSRISIYTERALVDSAIRNKDHKILGDRRPNTFY